jgi:small subunit ribosomal protein S15
LKVKAVGATQQPLQVFRATYFKMAVYLTIEKKKEIFKEFGKDEKNTGSVEGQIALFTYRIKSLSAHLNSFKKDHATRRSLLMMVGKRKRLLEYLKRKDIQKYRALIEKLEIRG